MISICCPTRNRPQFMTKFVDSIKKTKTGDVEILFRIDDDDKPSINCFLTIANEEIKAVIKPRRKFLASNYNELAEISTGQILMIAADDIEFKTPKWDTMVEESFASCEDKILLVYGNDGSKGGKTFGTHPFISRQMINILGYLAFPIFNRHIDSWINIIAERIDRKIHLPFETFHWTKSLMFVDANINDLNQKKETDTELFNLFKKNGFIDLECSKLRRIIKKGLYVI